MNPTNPTDSLVEPIIGALRIVDGKRLKDAAPCATSLSPPSQAARSRDGERLFILLDITGPVSSHLYRELREVTAQMYWSATGSITAALRRAADAANRHLFQANLHSTPSDQCHGGLICAVLRDDDIFILRAGPAYACFLHGEHLECFDRDENLPPLGTGRLADVRLHHAYVTPGDKLLLASPGLIRAVGDTGLVRVLTRIGVEDVLDGLEQVGAGADFSALAVRWPLPGEMPATREVPQPLSRLKTLTSLRGEPTRLSSSQAQSEGPVEPEPPKLSLQRPSEEAPAERQTPRLFPRLRASAELGFDRDEDKDEDEALPSAVEPPGRTVEPYEPLQPESLGPEEEEISVELEYSLPVRELLRPEPAREPGPGLGERVGEGVRAAGRGIATGGGVLAGGMSTLFRRMLPGLDRESRHQSRARTARSRPSRPVPQENRTVMMAIAIGIPIVLAITVILTYLSFGADARFRGLVKQAEEEVVLAQAAGSTTESARPHWDAVLERSSAAVALRPDDQIATALQAQAQAALDLLDRIVRLQPILLKSFGQGTVPRQLAIHGQMVFVLDPAGGWVSRLTLNQAGNGVLEQGDIPNLVSKGQSIGDGTVGDLVDFVWVDLAGGRQTSGLLILEQDGALVSYDPAWEGEGGIPQLQRSFLGVPPESPGAVGTYDGRFYVLDAAITQIRRYEPRGDTYPDRPDHYFVTPPPRLLTDVLDMAIDGYIYLLYADGAILKFLRGEPETFDVRGVPGDLSQAVALAVDPYGSSGVVYVVDQGNRRVVALGPDGDFQAQFRADEAFNALEALAVDEAMRRIYVISGGRLYVAPLP